MGFFTVSNFNPLLAQLTTYVCYEYEPIKNIIKQTTLQSLGVFNFKIWTKTNLLGNFEKKSFYDFAIFLLLKMRFKKDKVLRGYLLNRQKQENRKEKENFHKETRLSHILSIFDALMLEYRQTSREKDRKLDWQNDI